MPTYIRLAPLAVAFLRYTKHPLVPGTSEASPVAPLPIPAIDNASPSNSFVGAPEFGGTIVAAASMQSVVRLVVAEIFIAVLIGPGVVAELELAVIVNVGVIVAILSQFFTYVVYTSYNHMDNE